MGVPTHFWDGRIADLADVADLASGRVDDGRLGESLAACLLLDWPSAPESTNINSRTSAAISPSLAVLGPFFASTRCVHGTLG